MEKIAYVGQHENGIYQAEIRDESGACIAATVAPTIRDIKAWASEHKAVDLLPYQEKLR